jgi:LacI family transcriptional regulator
LAGVSTSTVSHVINDSRRVEPETKAKVLAAVESVGYRRDALARSMRRSKTDSIGLVISDAGEPAFAEMVHGVEAAAAQAGVSLLLANSAEDPARERTAVETLLDRRVDGLIIARASGSDPDLPDRISGEKKPLVLLDRLSELNMDQVGADNASAMSELVEHLVSKGHQRILLVAGDLRVPTLRERYDAFCLAMKEQDLEVFNGMVCEGTSTSNDTHRQVSETLGTARPGPTAVLACSTILAAGALRALQESGIQIPEAMAFAAFDGFAYSDLFEPQITTVRQPAFEMGQTAVELLIKRINDPSAPSETRRLKSSIEFRRSTER